MYFRKNSKIYFRGCIFLKPFLFFQHTPPSQQQFSHFPLLYTHPGQQQQFLNVHQTLQQQPKNSRSMSNLHSTSIGGQQQQTRERRKWNVGATQQQQQILQPAQMLQNQNGGGATFGDVFD